LGSIFAVVFGLSGGYARVNVVKLMIAQEGELIPSAELYATRWPEVTSSPSNIQFWLTRRALPEQADAAPNFDQRGCA
jgi:hypothetical protein